jgi:hypothetical protein
MFINLFLDLNKLQSMCIPKKRLLKALQWRLQRDPETRAISSSENLFPPESDRFRQGRLETGGSYGRFSG